MMDDATGLGSILGSTDALRNHVREINTNDFVSRVELEQ